MLLKGEGAPHRTQALASPQAPRRQLPCPPLPPARSPEAFGPVLGQLQGALPPGNLWIHDTATQGRPNALDLAIKAVRKEDAEAM